jgi:hypothetical protein
MVACSLGAELMVRQDECFDRNLKAMRYGDVPARRAALFDLQVANHERQIGRRVTADEKAQAEAHWMAIPSRPQHAELRSGAA